jgi:putative colanic acid biosynthesis UDP-glucose lipid carrier transferase
MNKLRTSTDKQYVKVIGEQASSYKSYITERKGYFATKRFVDIFISSLVCITLLSWMIPLLGLIIKLSSKGPVFFIQKRVGFAGKPFYCLKFRTMVINAEADFKQASQEDQRITKIGKLLRNTNLDEFPQFINVLMGDMSIVGPRPHMHADADKFSAVIPQYKTRYLVKPGITGLAQVKGYRGMVNCYEDIFHRYQFDAFYIRNANFGLDLRIIRLTAIQTIMIIADKAKGGLRKSKLSPSYNKI